MGLYFDAGAKEVWLCARSGAMSFFTSAAAPAWHASELCPQFPRQVELQ